jgi:hypothetical protein
MTARIKAFVVELEEPIREDDIEGLLNALRWMKFVSRVVPYVDDWHHNMAREEARREFAERAWAFAKEVNNL